MRGYNWVMENRVSETDSTGLQAIARRTVSAPIEPVWDYLIGRGLPQWLGETVLGNKGESYETADGVHGVVRSFHALDRLRVTWQRPGDAHDSTVEVAVTPGATGTTITFTHERLADAAEQKRMQKHWADVAVHVSESLLG